MKVIVGHKGKMSLRCHVHGLRMPFLAGARRGVNAVEYAAEVDRPSAAAWPGASPREGPFDADFDVPIRRCIPASSTAARR